MNARCPYCGEVTDTFFDEGGLDAQDYVEDCCVCCRPIRFLVRRDGMTGEVDITAVREDA